MLSGKGMFGSGSLTAAAAMVMLTQAFHSLLLVPLRAGETAAWLVVWLGGVVAFALYWPVARRVAALPGGNLIDLARVVAGPPGAVVAGVICSGLLVLHSGFVLREITEMAVSANFPHTPLTFALASTVAGTLYVARGRLDGVVRLCRLLLPVLVLTILLALLGTLGWGEWRFLLPFWGPGPGRLFRAAVGQAALYAPLTLFLLLAAGGLRDRRRLGRAGAVALIGASLLLAATMVVLLKTFPLPLGLSITFPLHELTRLIIGGRFFQRMEGTWLFVSAITTLVFLGALVHAAALAYTRAFAIPGHRAAVPALLTMAVTVALFPPDQGRALSWHAASLPLAWAIGFGLPLALALASLRARPQCKGVGRRGG